MTDTAAIVAAEIRSNPFFVLNGPDGRVLSCQWTCFDQRAGHAQGCEFEIVCPETPETMGMLFGLFEEGTFRMRPAIDCNGSFAVLVPAHDLDQAWRGTVDDVVEVGHDWDMGPDGLLVIADPEAPAEDPIGFTVEDRETYVDARGKTAVRVAIRLAA